MIVASAFHNGLATLKKIALNVTIWHDYTTTTYWLSTELFQKSMPAGGLIVLKDTSRWIPCLFTNRITSQQKWLEL
jgi:hypothetical protein